MDNEKVRLLMRTLSDTFVRKLVIAHVHTQTRKQLWPEARPLLNELLINMNVTGVRLMSRITDRKHI